MGSRDDVAELGDGVIAVSVMTVSVGALHDDGVRPFNRCGIVDDRCVVLADIAAEDQCFRLPVLG